MNIQQEGLGVCTRCGTPIMQAIGQAGRKGICFGCAEDGKPKTGRTVVVTSETGEGTALGSVKLQEVDHNPGASSALPKDPEGLRKAIMDKANAKGVAPTPILPPLPPTHEGLNAPHEHVETDSLCIWVSLKELEGDFSLGTILDKIYDAIDNLPPGKTLKETKRLIALQDKVNNLRFKKEK